MCYFYIINNIDLMSNQKINDTLIFGSIQTSILNILCKNNCSIAISRSRKIFCSRSCI